jgi:hypothetical protein
MGNGNAFAYLTLFGFLPLGVALFSVLRPAVAALLVFLISFMFLPEMVELDFPMVPGIGKQEVAGIACLVGVMLRARGRLWRARPLRGPDIFVLLLFVGDLGTALTNPDIIVWGPTVLPALSLHEAMSLIVYDLLRYLVPFLVGRALFTTGRDLKSLLAALSLAGAIYTPFLFVELMMSPQLHHWIYGFHQHDFLQTIRGGGYRPMVFMPHGLAVGLFMAWSAMAGVTLLKAKKRVAGLPPLFVTAYDMGWLLACKSLGAAIYAFVFLPVLWLLRPRAVVRFAAFLAVVVIAYPMLRATGLFPEKALVDGAAVVSARAAQSLDFRFSMEKLLSDRAAERPVFGWGRFRRSMIFDDYTGRDVSVSDGHWIVVYGIQGAWGFLCTFGLIVWPIFVLRRRLRRVQAPDERIMLAGLACILAVGAVDLLPNALHNSFTVFLAGALWGTTRALSSGPEVRRGGRANSESREGRGCCPWGARRRV